MTPEQKNNFFKNLIIDLHDEQISGNRFNELMSIIATFKNNHTNSNLDDYDPEEYFDKLVFDYNKIYKITDRDEKIEIILDDNV